MLENLTLDPVAFTIPIGDGFPIYWYAIFVTVGIALGAMWAGREIERRGQSSDEYFNGLILAVFSGYLFARLTYVLLDVAQGNTSRYSNAIDVINIRAGGANILGGFIGAALVVILYMRLRRLPLWHYADVAGMSLLLAQAIGRWGNFVNQELYGPPTTLPWGIPIEMPYRLPEYQLLPLDTRFHPTFLYESIWLFVGFILLANLNARRRSGWKPGTLFGLFLMWWGGGRFVIEFFRPDQATLGNSWVTYSMLASILLVLVGVGVLLYLSGRLPQGLQTRLEAIGARNAPRQRPAKPKLRRNDS